MFSNIISNFAGGASERGGPEIWKLAGRGILPKDALIP